MSFKTFKTRIAQSRSWKRKDRILFLERLESYVGAGLMLDKALEIAGQGIPEWQRLSVERVRCEVMAGSLLSKALIQHLRLPATLAGLISHGEASGQLVQGICAARNLMEREDDLSKKCVSALIYPTVIGVFASLLTIGLVRGVMPQITPLLKGLKVDLPIMTQVVMFISDSMVSYGVYMLLGAIVFVIAFLVSYKKLLSFKKICQDITVRVPLVGKLIHAYSLSLFLRSCGTLIESGASIGEAYASTTVTIQFHPLSRVLAGKRQQLDTGQTLGSVILASSKRIPSYVAPLISAGESSGTLGSSLVRAASIIDRDIEHSLKKLTSLIEPLMMAGMGLVVGGIALSIMMPIYDVSKALQ